MYKTQPSDPFFERSAMHRRDSIERNPYLRSTYWAKRLDIVSRLPENARVLDIGCNDGAMSDAALAAGRTDLSFIGVDVASKPIRLALQYAASGLYIRCDGLHLPFRNGAFHDTVAVEVIEHVARPLAFAVELRRITSTKGQIIITTPNAHSLPCRLHHAVKRSLRRLAGRKEGARDRLLSSGRLRRLFRRAGLETSIAYRYLYPVALTINNKTFGLSPPLPPSLAYRWVASPIARRNLPGLFGRLFAWTLCVTATRHGRRSPSCPGKAAT